MKLKSVVFPTEAIFYLMTRGISEEEARAMLVRGFVEPISKELPLRICSRNEQPNQS